MEHASAATPADLTLENFCSHPAIREAFTDSETSQIFKEIEEDPTSLKKYQGNAKVQRSLKLIYDLLQEHLPCDRPLQQPLQLPEIMQTMTQLCQQPNSSIGSADLQSVMGMIAQPQGHGGAQNLIQQLIQQGSAGMGSSSAYQQLSSTLQAQTGHPPQSIPGLAGHPPQSVPGLAGHPPQSVPGLAGHPPPNLPGPDGHPPPNQPRPVRTPNIPKSSGRSSPGNQMSNRGPPIPLPVQEYQSVLPSKRRVSNDNMTPSEDQYISVLPPK